MEFNTYQKKALRTALYPKKHKVIYPALGLGGEAGEVLDKVQKWLRGDDGQGQMKGKRKEAIREELGDVLWFLAVLAADLGLKLEDIAGGNIKKLESRQKRGVLHGDGDKR